MVEDNIDLRKYLDAAGPAFFKAKDMKTDKTKTKITNVREVDLRNSGDTVIIDFPYKKLERSLPLNITNLKTLIELFGMDPKKWISKEITLMKVLTRDPKKNKEVEGIRIR